jgi:cytochrome c6
MNAVRLLLLLGLVIGACLLQQSPLIAGDIVAIYSLKCAGCHGSDGKANTVAGKKFAMKDLTDPKVQAKYSDTEWEKMINEGVDTVDGKIAMPAYARRVRPEDVKALVKYCRDFARK